MVLPRSVDPERLRRRLPARFYFRYRLTRHDFFQVRADGRLLGYATAKPLYASLLSDGKVDRASGYDGRIAVLFLRSPVRADSPVHVVLTRSDPEMLVRGGRIRAPAVRQAAVDAVRALH